MLSLRKTRILAQARQHASVKDFCNIFHQDMDLLYWLAMTLTADEHKAERCFVAGLDECIEGNAVFQEWARSWSRRVVIKNAIRLISPRPDVPLGPRRAGVLEKLSSPAEIPQAVLAQMRPFDRFVFVMSLVEGYADRDCATLLSCSSMDVVEARLRALEHLRQTTELSPAPEGHGTTPRDAMVLSDATAA